MDRLRTLQLFRQVAAKGSFSAVARESGLPQPTVSRAIAELEADLGVRLLTRTTRRVGLTASGRSYLDRVEQALRGLEEADSAVRAGFSDLSGRIKVGLPGVIGRRLVAPRLVRALLEHRHLRVELAVTDRLADFIEEGFDFAVRVSAQVPESFIVRPIAESPQCVVATPGYLAGRPPIASVTDLEGHDGVFRDTRTARLLEGGGLTTRFIADDMELAWRATREGVGISILPFWLVRDDLSTGRLVELFEGSPKPVGQIVAVYPTARGLSEAARWALDLVSKQVLDSVRPLSVP